MPGYWGAAAMRAIASRIRASIVHGALFSVRSAVERYYTLIERDRERILLIDCVQRRFAARDFDADQRSNAILQCSLAGLEFMLEYFAKLLQCFLIVRFIQINGNVSIMKGYHCTHL